MATSFGASAQSPESAHGVLLCADDFAMTNGISRAIIELAEAGRISAASAMTNSPHWPAHATWLARVRGRISTGLHLNMTLGSPLGAMPEFAVGRRFPTIGQVTSRALTGRINRAEVRAEIERQITAFEAEMGFPPDHVDGHQHVHALPVIRTALLQVLSQRYPPATARPLLRDPADRTMSLLARKRGLSKAVTLAVLSAGFGAKARAAGFQTNRGFAGVTGFSPKGVSADFTAASRAAGPRHLVMCHPGFVDAELIKLDPITERRQQEFGHLLQNGFPSILWRTQRSASGEPIAWSTAWTGSP